MQAMNNDLVSIVMLSSNGGQYVEETVKSVLAQTYQNWELLFVDDNSRDDTVSKMMELKGNDRRIKISQTVVKRGTSANRNGALREAHGRWIAFLDTGDVWAPDKLEKQIAFMEANGYAFTYTEYGLMDEASKDRGVQVSGKEHITYQDMLKCCWPAYMTVMYDAQKIGRVQVQNFTKNNDYALWLYVSKKAACHLLKENLAMLRTSRGRYGRFLMTDKLKWRYEVYQVEEGLNPFTSFFYTIRNGWFGIKKWMNYVKKSNIR